jgi:hypothetical protein
MKEYWTHSMLLVLSSQYTTGVTVVKVYSPTQRTFLYFRALAALDRVCALAARFPACRPRGPGLDSRR